MRYTVITLIVALALLPHVAVAEEAPSVADTTDLVNLMPAELFLRASSSALQFQAMLQPSRRLLIRNHEASIPYLVTQLDTDDARERHALEDIFVRIGSPAVDALVESLAEEITREDTSRGARLAARILGRIGDGAGAGPLIAARDHADWKVRGSVAEALGRIADPEGAPALTELLSDENEIVRKSAAVGLARLAEAAGDGETALDDAAIEALKNALADPYYSVRQSAVRALVGAGDPVVDELIDLAAEAGEPVRILAIQALGDIGSEDALPALRDHLRSESWAAAAHAAEALGKIGLTKGDRKALERMIEGGSHPYVLHKIEEALVSSES
jgi:HEAT repeat protein